MDLTKKTRRNDIDEISQSKSKKHNMSSSIKCIKQINI
jgi:hypothetical protein